MDDVVNRFARELADAIAAAVADNAEVEACKSRVRAAGYEMKVTLEAIVGFVNRNEAPTSVQDGPASVTAAARVAGPKQTAEMTTNDRRFLRSLRIAADDATVEEAN